MKKPPFVSKWGLGAVLNIDKVKSFALALCGILEIVAV